MALTIPQSQPSKMLGDIDIQKYGIRSVSMISEGTFAPRLLVKHLDGKDFSYVIGRAVNISVEDYIEKKLKEHIRKECIVQLRKEKLENLDSLKVIWYNYEKSQRIPR